MNHPVDTAIRNAVETAITDSLMRVTIEKRLYTVRQAAVYLGRSRDAVARMVREGHLQITSHDSKILIDVLEMDSYCQKTRHRHEAAA